MLLGTLVSESSLALNNLLTVQGNSGRLPWIRLALDDLFLLMALPRSENERASRSTQQRLQLVHFRWKRLVRAYLVVTAPLDATKTQVRHTFQRTPENTIAMRALSVLIAREPLPVSSVRSMDTP